MKPADAHPIGLRTLLAGALALSTSCGGKAVVDGEPAPGEIETSDACSDMPVPTTKTFTCDTSFAPGTCRVVQCDDAGNRYEIDCEPNGTEAGFCRCIYNGETVCTGEGDFVNTCPNGVPGFLCPGFSWADFDPGGE